jgi:hypothetical protein
MTTACGPAPAIDWFYTPTQLSNTRWLVNPAKTQ